MANVLVVRKKDRTIHVVPINNRAALMAYNNRQPSNERYKLEVMEESEAKKLPFIDPDYVSANDAQALLRDVKGELSEKDSRIADLEAQLAALNKETKPVTVTELIEMIGKAETVEEAKSFLENETRVTALTAIQKRISELQPK